MVDTTVEGPLLIQMVPSMRGSGREVKGTAKVSGPPQMGKLMTASGRTAKSMAQVSIRLQMELPLTVSGRVEYK